MSPSPILSRARNFVEQVGERAGHQPGQMRERLQHLGEEHPSLAGVTDAAHRAITRLRGPLADNSDAPEEENGTPEAPLGWADADREYLRTQPPEKLKAAIIAIKRVARDVRTREIKEGKIQIHVGDLTEPQIETLQHLRETLNRLTGPAVKDAGHTEACAQMVESIIPEIEKMLDAIETEGPLNERNMSEAHEQIQAAIQTDGAPEGATSTSNEAIIRYALACALLALQSYEIEHITEEHIIDPQTPLKNSQKIKNAANALGVFLGFSTGIYVRSALEITKMQRRQEHPGIVAEKIREKCPFILNS